MAYIIDGHNLIGKLPDLHLADLDDEEALIRRVSAFCAANRKTAEIYFDRAAPGRAGRRRFGSVTAVFVHSGSTADAAIRKRLADLGRQARNEVVVSSDRQVQAEARAAGARVVSSEEFSSQMQAEPRTPAAADRDLSADELQEWLDLFDRE